MATKTCPGRYDERDIEALDRLAEATGRSRNHHLNEALKGYLAQQSWQIAHIQEGLADLDAGHMTSQEEVMAESRRVIAEARARQAAAQSTS